MEKNEYIPQALGKAFFHGEQWFGCPNCRFVFEYFEAVFGQKGIKTAGERIYVCPECGKKFRID